MISTSLSEAIKDIIGRDYANKILEYLSNKGVKKSNGKEYIRQEVYNCVNGTREYEELESHIFDYAEEVKSENEKKKAKAKALLQ